MSHTLFTLVGLLEKDYLVKVFHDSEGFWLLNVVEHKVMIALGAVVESFEPLALLHPHGVLFHYCLYFAVAEYLKYNKTCKVGPHLGLQPCYCFGYFCKGL